MGFDQEVFETTTTWTTGIQQFSGPRLWDVLERVGAGAGDLELHATNDYTARVTRDLITQTSPIIANRIDGASFGPRNKGPLWVVFPYDRAAEFKSELVYAASVWQLSRISVLKD